MISVIVPAKNEQGFVGRCLEALLSQEGLSVPVEVLVVDDASTDGTAAEARRYQEGHGSLSVRIVAGPGRGVSAARNTGAAQAKGDVLLFTDADCRPVPGWAAALLGAALQDGVSGATGGQRSDQRELVARLVQAEYDEKQSRLARSERVTFADTATVAYRSEAFRAVGGFDESLRNFEDTELAFRLAEAGHRLVVVPAAVVRHRHVTGLAAYMRRKRRIGFWGAAVYRAHPGKVIDDSRTPWSMRLQMVLAPVLVLAAGAVLIAALASAGSSDAAAAGGAVADGAAQVLRVAVALAALVLVAFVATAVPFAGVARGHGLDALVAAPFFLFARALALDAGLVAGVIGLATGSHPALQSSLLRPERQA